MPLLEKTHTAGGLAAGAHTDSADAFVPDQSRAERPTSFAVADFAMPSGREEEWRFTPVDRLRALFGDTPTDEGALTYAVSAPEGVTTGTLAPGQTPRGTALVPADRAAVVASANTPQALHVVIGAEAEPSEPVRIVLNGTAGRRSNAHYVIEAKHHSKAVVILDHEGGGEHTGNLEVIVGDGAQLTVVSVQHWDDGAIHLGQHDAVVGRDAAYKHIVVTIGGDIVRINTNVRYAGPGGQATLLGVYFADAGQHLEHRSFVDHDAPRCKSTVTYKGALQGEGAHTVWVGDVLIRAEAEGTETYELNRNLVLTDGARADSVPNLEIETGEIVGAGHASATGRFDDEQLFYLQARGIPEAQARRLVVRGFLVDVINQIPDEALRTRLQDDIEAELAAAAEVGAVV
ncbi:MAG: Fe-S cluster assembly protein SufD [Lapillicoccus sp.]